MTEYQQNRLDEILYEIVGRDDDCFGHNLPEKPILSRTKKLGIVILNLKDPDQRKFYEFIDNYQEKN